MSAQHSLEEQTRDLAAWNTWANRVVGDVIEGAGEAPLAAVRAYQHIFETELTWLQRILGHADPNMPLWGEASVTQAHEWRVRSAALLAEVAGRLDQGILGATISYANSRGQTFEEPAQEPLFQTLMHSMQYRGEAAAFVNAAGLRVPDFDYIFWTRSGRPE